MGNLFYYPLRRDLYSYHREDDYDAYGERKTARGEAHESPLDAIHRQFCARYLLTSEGERASALINQVDNAAYARRFAHWTPDEVSDLKCHFAVFDLNRDGVIDFQELERVLEMLGEGSTRPERRRLFDEIDLDGSESIDLEEFLIHISKCQLSAPASRTNLYEVVQRGCEQIRSIRSASVYKQLTNGFF